MERPSILVIDDEPDNFDVIETLLSTQGYQFHYHAGGQEAIAALDLIQPDLILLDVMMPEIDGISLCKRIRDIPKWRPIPIVMVTALVSKDDLARCLEAGADDFLSKPLNKTELQARVHSMLRIKQQHDDLQTLLKFREDMVHMVVHDLRNRLTEVLLGIEFLKMNINAINADDLRTVHESAQDLQILVDDLLKIALFESNNISLNRTAVDVRHLVQEAVSKVGAIASQKNQTLTAQFSENLMEKIPVDATMMRRVLDNLLSNAIKFSPHHSQIIVNVEIHHSSELRIQVIDSGPGVPDTLRQKIFEKYEIGTLMPNVTQIGLGLALCKMIVEAHGGSIGVKNNQPQGAIFEMILSPH